MTKDRDFKRVVRRRARETGERYSEARSRLEKVGEGQAGGEWLVAHTFPETEGWVREWLLERFPSELSEVLLPRFQGEVLPPGMLVLKVASRERLSEIARGCWFTDYAGSPDEPLLMSWEAVKHEIEKQGIAALRRRPRNRSGERFRGLGSFELLLRGRVSLDARMELPRDFHLDLDEAATAELLERISAAANAANAPGQQGERLTQIRRGIADIATSRRRVELQVQELQAVAADLEGQARQATTGNRSDLAGEALSRRAAIDAQLAQPRAQHQQLLEQEERLVAVIREHDARGAESLTATGASGLIARQELVEAYRPLVDRAVAEFFGTTQATASELDTAGLDGLSHAIDRYASTRGVRFLPFAWWWIRQSILRHLATTGPQSGGT